MANEQFETLMRSAKAARELAEEMLRTGRDETGDGMEFIAQGVKDAAAASELVAKAVQAHERKAAGAKARAAISELSTLPADYVHGESYIAAKGHLNLRSKSISKGIQNGMTVAGPDGQKAVIAAGSAVIPIPTLPGIQLTDRAPLSLLEAFPLVTRPAPVYRFLRESVRTNNAAVVAAGATKPTSVFTLTTVDARLRVIAHTSEAIDKYALRDAGSLEQFVTSEMVLGLEYALEQEVLNGDGTGEHFVGLANTSGILTVTSTGGGAYILPNFSRAITAVETLSSSPAFFLMSFADWAGVSTARNESGNFDFGSPAAATARQIYGVPVVPTTALPVGTSYLVSEGAAEISTDGRIDTEWDGGGVLFGKNQLQARVEGRFGLDVLRPSGIVKITTAA